MNENVLVRIIKAENEGQSVLLPDTHKKEEFGMGEVLGRAEGFPVEVGDVVIFDTILLTRVKIEGEELMFIKFSDILAVYGRAGKETTDGVNREAVQEQA